LLGISCGGFLANLAPHRGAIGHRVAAREETPSCPWAHRTLIFRKLNAAFDTFGDTRSGLALDFYPEALRAEIAA